MLNFNSINAASFAIIILFTTPAIGAVSSDIKVTRTTQSEPLKFYLGGSFGNAAYDKANNSDVGFNIFAGFQPWRSLGFEFSYVNLGDANVAGALTTNYTLFRGGVVTNYQFKNGQLLSGLAIFGQTGLSVWDADSTLSNSGTDLYFGGGLIQSLGRRAALRYAIEYYTFSNTDFANENVIYLNIGFQLQLN